MHERILTALRVAISYIEEDISHERDRDPPDPKVLAEMYASLAKVRLGLDAATQARG